MDRPRIVGGYIGGCDRRVSVLTLAHSAVAKLVGRWCYKEAVIVKVYYWCIANSSIYH